MTWDQTMLRLRCELPNPTFQHIIPPDFLQMNLSSLQLPRYVEITISQQIRYLPFQHLPLTHQLGKGEGRGKTNLLRFRNADMRS